MKVIHQIMGLCIKITWCEKHDNILFGQCEIAFTNYFLYAYLYPKYEKVSQYEKCVAELAKFSIDKFTQDNNINCVTALNHILKRMVKVAIECNKIRIGPNNGQTPDEFSV